MPMSWFLILLSKKKNQVFLENGEIGGFRTGIENTEEVPNRKYTICQKHLVVPGIKEILSKTKNTIRAHESETGAN